MEDGYNTNYAASYFLVRTAPKTARTGVSPNFSIAAATGGAHKGLIGSLGPLTRRLSEAGNVPTSNLPLLGDSGPGDINEAVLTQTLERKDTDWIGTLISGADAKGGKLFVPAGSLLCEAFNDGPGQYRAATPPKIQLIEDTAILDQQITNEASGIQGEAIHVGVAGPNSYLQDTRDFFAIHAGGACNILMADGSVKNFSDLNGDKYYNPGFPVPPPNSATPLTEPQYAGVGYRNSDIELPPGEIYSGVFLEKRIKGRFE